MAKIVFTLKNITREIAKAEKKLQAIRKKAVRADLRRIELNLRGLKKSYGTIQGLCRLRLPQSGWPPLRRPPLFGQVFRTKSK